MAVQVHMSLLELEYPDRNDVVITSKTTNTQLQFRPPLPHRSRRARCGAEAVRQRLRMELSDHTSVVVIRDICQGNTRRMYFQKVLQH